METILELIAQNGLGVAAAITVGWWYVRKDKEHGAVIEKYSDRLQTLNDEAHKTTLEREVRYQELVSAVTEHLKKDSDG